MFSIEPLSRNEEIASLPVRVLTHLRHIVGVSQNQLSRGVGISQSTLSYYEHGLDIPDYAASRLLRYFSEQIGAQIVPPAGMSGSEFLLARSTPEMRRYIASLIAKGG